ncbi:endonuclease MutS2 [Paenibacillus motobuensis]|uniref:endonuclease MutS2 n=1 Tax=Paenibacillus TaxID=44249 RepID=UPI00203F0032|nr:MULTISPECIES: endonuclease MutS2 [Paenibacillus]MCM3042512.1 endonuclease MutS2 [Paenibacillus lutimineralis]MCM3649616.1 endonuclease MutS2 [Paenibacillus motobuensis]
MNISTFDKLQYDELKEIVKSFCVSGLGKQLIDKLQPSANLSVVKARLNETTEARAILDTESHVPLVGISNIQNFMDKLEKGMILDPSELVAIADFLRGCRKMRGFMRERELLAPKISAYVYSMTEFAHIEDRIHASIKGNQVDSAASKELKRIRKHIDIAEAKIEEQLQRFLKNSANKEYIQEFFVSKKNDRFTIPIKAAYKNHVPGAIVEVSSKGATVFIEPISVSKYNAELASLKAEEVMEEYQILADLSNLIFDHAQSMNINIELISQYDMIFAKGKFSRSIDGIEPLINDHGYMKLVSCRHPLLTGKVVPLNFEIGDSYRSLVITGPNAGGKTVVLKTIGLITLATMSGFHISAAPGTEVALFRHVFVDIGDNQSLENALSTFSSHMKNISEIMYAADRHTLLLFDEIGSGTEPNEGAALAIAILEEFYHMGCITVATTHYGEIKQYSEMHSDFMNAAMEFNQETLEPQYRLMIGQSGDSNALWISRKMKLKEHVLERAKSYMQRKEYRLDRLQSSKVSKPKNMDIAAEAEIPTYTMGDKVKLLDRNESAIVYRGLDSFNNLVVFVQDTMLEVHYKRVALELRASELYPEGYDLNMLFTSYQERKFQHDMQRGSKKALRKVQKEMWNQRRQDTEEQN